LYEYYVDSNQKPYKAVTAVETLTGNGAAYQVVKLQTPRVVQTTKEHFDCTSINGFELESSGGSGTAGSHWDKRVGGLEYMTGFVNEEMPVTVLTMSLFEGRMRRRKRGTKKEEKKNKKNTLILFHSFSLYLSFFRHGLVQSEL
jgi:hypothetical protein